MKVVFTICSNNYLGQANTLLKSICATNPAIKFYIGLVDKKSNEIDYSGFEPAIVLPIADAEIDCLDDMVSKYNIIELNTAVKPFLFQYIIRQNPQITGIYYFDPDTVVFQKLDLLHNLLVENDFILTPHILSTIPDDGILPYDHLFLNYGIYNLGFLGLNPQSEEVKIFLNWWGHKTSTLGFDKVSEGLFVDQLWANLIPIFYKKVHILRNIGFNMAPWNLHERSIEKIEGNQIELNDGSNLVFYHFSNYKFSEPFQISKYYTKFPFEKYPLLKTLYDVYYKGLKENGYEKYSKVKCVYINDISLMKAKSDSVAKKYARKFFSKILKLPF